MNRLWLVMLSMTPAAGPMLLGQGDNAPQITANYSLTQALEKVLTHSPELNAQTQHWEATKAMRLQAGLGPNPELELETENFGGKGALSRFRGAETTVQVAQHLELGGKRLRRKQVADLDVDLARQDLEALRLDLTARTKIAFVDVWVAQERMALHRELLDLAKEIERSVKARVEAGKISPLEEIKARVTVANAQVRLTQSQHSLTAKKATLSGLWGDDRGSFSRVTGSLNRLTQLPKREELTDSLKNNSDLVRWDLVIQRQKQNLGLEKSRSRPDVSLKAGFRYFDETNDKAWLAGFSVSLPVFDRNQGHIRMAGFQVDQAKAQKRAATTKARVKLTEIYESVTASYHHAGVLQSSVIPASTQALDGLREGFRQGKFGYLDVLDAQRTFFEAKVQLIELLGTYHRQFAQLEHLLGGPVKGTSKQEGRDE